MPRRQKPPSDDAGQRLEPTQTGIRIRIHYVNGRTSNRAYNGPIKDAVAYAHTMSEISLVDRVEICDLSKGTTFHTTGWYANPSSSPRARARKLRRKAVKSTKRKKR